jgi:high affinity Mn2+ porin
VISSPGSDAIRTGVFAVHCRPKQDIARSETCQARRPGRPDDTIGIAGVVNGISSIHAAFLNAGGLGVLVGDGRLPHCASEKIIEAYYSYALTPSTRLTLDYQYLRNPGYNADRGPANIFATRVHRQF